MTRDFKLREPEDRVRYLTGPEAETLFQTAGRDPRAGHLPDPIRLALHTGMRKRELLYLEWDRVDWSRRLIHPRSAGTKSGQRRSIPLDATARAALVSRAAFRAAKRPASRWVFCDEQGAFAGRENSAGIMDFHFYDLRHTRAAWMIQTGVPLAEIRDLLGHASIKMTERHARLAPENIRATVAVLDEASRRDRAGTLPGVQEAPQPLEKLGAPGET